MSRLLERAGQNGQKPNDFIHIRNIKENSNKQCKTKEKQNHTDDRMVFTRGEEEGGG